MAFDFLESSVEALVFNTILQKSSDGSWLAVETDKPSYFAGETITGRVVAHVINAINCDAVVIKVKCKEKVKWDAEDSRIEGPNDNRKVVWTHYTRESKDTLFKEVVVVSSLNHVLPPGDWVYPFTYTLRPNLPGCLKFKHKERSRDSSYHKELEAHAGIVYSLKAQLKANNGVFSREIKCTNELVVNSFFDWSKLQPAHAEKTGEVRLLCCIPRGKVNLKCDFDKAAYAAGETAMIKAAIDNKSKSNVGNMVVKLMRMVELRDKHGHSKTITDTVCKAKYEGVAAGSSAARDLPLPFVLKNCKSGSGFIPSTCGKFSSVSYRVDVECDIAFAPDIEAHLPVTIYQPAPVVWGLQAAFAGQNMPVISGYAPPVAVAASAAPTAPFLPSGDNVPIMNPAHGM